MKQENLWNLMLKCVFFSQLPVPRRLLQCWESKSIETLSEIIREHSQLCNFIITTGTTVFIKTSIQVLKQCTHLKAIERCITQVFKILI